LLPIVRERRARMDATRCKGLDLLGARVHFVQVGLGTNATFVQNLGGDPEVWDRTVAWLLSACSESTPSQITGVSVEPVAELVEALWRFAAKLPGVDLVQVAIGEEDQTAEMEILPVGLRDKLLDSVPEDQQSALRDCLEYLLNMGCVGCEHPESVEKCERIFKSWGVRVNLERRPSPVWSWRRLSEAFHFRGCEVLMVDAEGSDARILRSMMKHCREEPDTWPWVIQLETMGHCDHVDGRGTEWQVIAELVESGYVLLHYSWRNSHLALASALEQQRLKSWAEFWVCDACSSWADFPYVSGDAGTWCRRCTEEHNARPLA
jgi:hypothetical protein